ncbi:MAG: hypothetical protein ACPHQT_09590 [Planctomycetota bacterium]
MLHTKDSIIGLRSSEFATMNRWLLLALILIVGSVQNQASAQVFCDPANPTYGTCFLQTGTFSGDLPFAVTLIPATNDLYVADYLSGVFYRYDALDLAAAAENLACPKGPATYLGMAFSVLDNNLYWIVNDQGSLLLVVSSLGGSFISETELTPPSGTTALSGLTWFPSTNTLWTNDFENDQYLEMNMDGSFTGNSFGNPQSSGAAGAFGLGLSVAQDILTFEFFFDLPVGPPSANRTSLVERVNSNGESQGLSFPLASINNLSGWITGIAWAPQGSAAESPSNFLLDLTNRVIVEVPVPNPPAPSITSVDCTADSSNDVTLSWTNPLAYDQVEIFRDGTLISTLGPGGDTFLDEDLEPGSYSYEVVPFPAGASSGLPAATCELVVGFGRLLGEVAHSGTAPGGADVIESTNQLIVADSSGLTAWFYQKDLTPLSTSIPGPYSSAQSLAGIAADGDDNLAWLTESGDLRITDLSGTETAAFALALNPGAVLGGLTWSAQMESWLTVNLAEGLILKINTDGTLEEVPAALPTGMSAATFFGGIASRAGSTNVYDLAFGALNSGGVTRLERFVGNTPVGLGFDLTPSVNSGDIRGLAATANGPFNFPVTYVVGRDSGTITMLSGDLSGTGSDFVRGDAVADGSLNLLDATEMLLQLFQLQDSLCLDSLDANDDGAFNIADPLLLLDYLFSGGTPISDPSGVCGEDPTVDNLTCQEFPGC